MYMSGADIAGGYMQGHMPGCIFLLMREWMHIDMRMHHPALNGNDLDIMQIYPGRMHDAHMQGHGYGMQ